MQNVLINSCVLTIMILSVYNNVFLHFLKNANVLQYEITLVLSICQKADKLINIIHFLHVPMSSVCL